MTGLTYCGHPLVVCRGRGGARELRVGAADRALARTRAPRMLARLQELQARHDADRRRARRPRPVRGRRTGARPRHARAARAVAADARRRCVACWQRRWRRGVSFAARGNLMLLAPPLVIDEARAGRCAGPTGPPARRAGARAAHGARRMSFKLTYATMFDPPAEMHARFEAARGARSASSSGATHALFIDGEDVAPPSATSRRRNPRIDRDWCSASFPPPAAEDVGRRAARGGRGVSRLARDAGRGARAPAAPRRAADRGARLRHRRGADARGRQEPHGGARRSAGDRRLLHALLATTSSSQHGFDRALPDDPLAGLRLAQPQRDEAVRRVGRDRAVQLPARARRRAGRGGARHRQYRRAEGRERHAVGGPPARGLHPRRRLAAGRLQLPERPGRAASATRWSRTR